jgi:hypothetical protein
MKTKNKLSVCTWLLIRVCATSNLLLENCQTKNLIFLLEAKNHGAWKHKPKMDSLNLAICTMLSEFFYSTCLCSIFIVHETIPSLISIVHLRFQEDNWQHTAHQTVERRSITVHLSLSEAYEQQSGEFTLCMWFFFLFSYNIWEYYACDSFYLWRLVWWKCFISMHTSNKFCVFIQSQWTFDQLLIQ